MGDRYFMKCPNCGEELYIGNWTNYACQCPKCHKYFVVTQGLREISKGEFEEIAQS
jgi:Zn finger protein HypA/HybF involved in hydrogenase expression